MATRTSGNFPTYIAESTEIDVNTKIPGCSIIGGTVFLTDTGAWMIVNSDQTVVDFYFPVATPA